MKKKVLAIAFLMFSVTSLAQVAEGASEADAIGQAAQRACDRIQQDEIWQRELSNAAERETVLRNPSVSRSNETYFNLLRFSYRATAAAVDDIAKQPGSPSRELTNFIIRRAALRTLQRCGASLHQQGKIIYLDNENDKERFFARVNECVAYQNALMDRVSKTPNLSRRDRDEAILFSRDPLECRSIFPNISNGRLVYPLHLNIRNGAAKFEEQLNSKEFNDAMARIDEIVNRGRTQIARAEEARIALAARLEEGRIAQALRDEQAMRAREDRMIRLDNIRRNPRAANTCGEIAEALIPPDNIILSVGGFPVSRNSQSVLRTPSRNLYATSGTLISHNTRQAITYDVNMFNNQGHAFVLRFSRQTIWFNEVVSAGTRLYFVGRYVDNANVPIRQGTSNFDVPARTFEVVCASSL